VVLELHAVIGERITARWGYDQMARIRVAPRLPAAAPGTPGGRDAGVRSCGAGRCRSGVCPRTWHCQQSPPATGAVIAVVQPGCRRWAMGHPVGGSDRTLVRPAGAPPIDPTRHRLVLTQVTASTRARPRTSRRCTPRRRTRSAPRRTSPPATGRFAARRSSPAGAARRARTPPRSPRRIGRRHRSRAHGLGEAKGSGAVLVRSEVGGRRAHRRAAPGRGPCPPGAPAAAS
jgi:hypothetical protein